VTGWNQIVESSVSYAKEFGFYPVGDGGKGIKEFKQHIRFECKNYGINEEVGQMLDIHLIHPVSQHSA
jgi:hypothetical protein